MVTLGNEVAGKVLNYLAANFGTAIWDYFRLVDEAIEKSISRHIPWGQRGDQFSVMVVYLNSLNLKRPVVSKNEEENVVWWDDVESDDDNDNNDQDVDGISESEDNNDGKRSDDKFVNTSSGKVTVPDGNSSVQNSSSAFVAVNASTVDKRNLSLPQQTASEVALAELSNSMLNMASQMKNTVEAFVKDVTQIKKNLKVSNFQFFYLLKITYFGKSCFTE